MPRARSCCVWPPGSARTACPGRGTRCARRWRWMARRKCRAVRVRRRCRRRGSRASPLQWRPFFSCNEDAMAAIPSCPQCGLDNTYADGALWICPDCAHEWTEEEGAEAEAGLVVRDSNGNPLAAGDTVVVIKDLKVKGSSIPLKQGTVIRNIRLVEGDAEHIEGNSDKIKGLVLKTQFLRKA